MKEISKYGDLYLRTEMNDIHILKLEACLPKLETELVNEGDN